MRIKKVQNAYDSYQADLSLIELQSIVQSIAADHSDPVSDNIYHAIQFYLEKLPQPGEEEGDNKPDPNKAAMDKAFAPMGSGEDDVGLDEPPSREEAPPEPKSTAASRQPPGDDDLGDELPEPPPRRPRE